MSPCTTWTQRGVFLTGDFLLGSPDHHIIGRLWKNTPYLKLTNCIWKKDAGFFQRENHRKTPSFQVQLLLVWESVTLCGILASGFVANGRQHVETTVKPTRIWTLRVEQKTLYKRQSWIKKRSWDKNCRPFATNAELEWRFQANSNLLSI